MDRQFEKKKIENTHECPIKGIHIQAFQFIFSTLLNFFRKHLLPRVQLDNFNPHQKFTDSSQTLISVCLENV